MHTLFCSADVTTGCLPVLDLIQIFPLMFLCILFIQSGLDKFLDWSGNIGWLTGHFSKTPFKNVVKPMVASIAILELAAGVTSGVGVVMILLAGSKTMGIIGACLSALSLIGLFFGQRIAKDYDGAVVIVPYFIVTLLTLFFLM